MKLLKISPLLLALASIAMSNMTQAHPVHKPKANVVKQKLQQVDGYYRVMLGDYEVTALYDGYLSIGTPAYQQFSSLSKQQLDELISNQFRPMLPDGGVNTAVTGYLINTGKNLILLEHVEHY